MKIKSLFSPIKNLLHVKSNLIIVSIFCGLIVICIIYIFFLRQQESKLQNELSKTKQTLQTHVRELTALKNEDQYVKNKELENTISQIEKTYVQAVTIYEQLLDLKGKTNDTAELDKLFASSLTYLSQRNYASGSAKLATLSSEIQKKEAAIASEFNIPQNVAQSNTPPGSGYQQQSVNTEIGTFLVDIIAADLNSTRVIVDTASESDCRNDCPVLSLSDYSARSSAFAGINGPYFCPADYPSCSDKKNSFDTLLMNKNKVYFNSSNNVYSTVPAVIFSDNSARYVGQSLEWGRDGGVDSVIASQPMLISGGNIVYGGDGEPKRGSRGARSFVGSTGSTVYIGVVFNATVAEVAYVLKTLGIQYGLNLDSGGSTALLYQGRYLVGPGRNTPFGILFVSK